MIVKKMGMCGFQSIDGWFDFFLFIYYYYYYFNSQSLKVVLKMHANHAIPFSLVAQL